MDIDGGSPFEGQLVIVQVITPNKDYLTLLEENRATYHPTVLGSSIGLKPR